MEKNERKALNTIKNILKNSEEENEEIVEEISRQLSLVQYSNILSQKIVPKILLNHNMNEDEKILILDKIAEQYSQENVENYIIFVKTMLKVEEKYLFQIRELISKDFDSLFVFMTMLGMYTRENPEIIELPKKIIIEQAQDILRDDMALNDSQSQIIISYNTYISKKGVIENIYRVAVKYGCIIEKFEDISYSKEEVVNVNVDNVPFFELEVTDWLWKRRLMFASAYYSTVTHCRDGENGYERDAIYNYYKCYICKKSTILNVNPEVKSLIQCMLERQFAAENLFQLLVRYACVPDYKLANLASYSFSIYLLLYIELLFLILNDSKAYTIYDLNDIKKNMFGARIISYEEFLQVINICFSGEKNKSLKTYFYRKENGIVLGSWMFNSDLFILEKIDDLIFNTRMDEALGKEVNVFGKKIFEGIVKKIANTNSWKTLESNIAIKCTDFDLVAYKNGSVILGQVKASHTTRKPYSIWKANEVILEANKQISKCKRAIEADKYLLYANLKREKIVSRIDDIKNVIFIIISGNSYLNGKGDVPVIGIEDWANLLKMDVSMPEFYDFLECPPMMYKLDNRPEYRESIIETEEYVLLYNELE